MRSVLVHFNSQGNSAEDEPISINEAFYLVENQDSIKDDEESYLGFTHSKDAIIQFIRLSKDRWILDIPTYDGDEYKGSLNCEINHSYVFIIISEFFDSTPFQGSIIAKDYENLKKISQERWNLAYSLNFEE